MKFWNWGPTTIWHDIECVAFYFSKSLHPNLQYSCNSKLLQKSQNMYLKKTSFLGKFFIFILHISHPYSGHGSKISPILGNICQNQESSSPTAPGKKEFLKSSVSDPDSGAVWIRIRNRRYRIQGLKKRTKLLNQRKIILLFPTLYLSIDFV